MSEREKWERCDCADARRSVRDRGWAWALCLKCGEGMTPRTLALADRAERAEALIRKYVEWLDGRNIPLVSHEVQRISDAMRALLSDLDAREKAGREA